MSSSVPLSTAPRCALCQAPLDALRQRAGTCEAPACLHAGSLRRLQDARDELNRVWEEARALGAQAEVSLPPSADHTQRGIAVVPRNKSASRVASKRRHAKLLAHVREQLQESRKQSPEQIARHRAQPAELPADVGALFGTACAACRGHCCRGGGEHAYLNERTMQEYRERHPSMSDEDIAEAYRSRLPARSQVPGCVYQGTKGCTLPRDMRSAICNSHLCHGLKEALSQHTAGAPLRGLHVLHRIGTAVSYRRYTELPIVDE
ncbi:MAG: hypothetical protein IBJ03_05110 [Gemmatimonadaceae bacterium]|nr:hypothetical protein [Gemmatimonadaceae bacterium]